MAVEFNPTPSEIKKLNTTHVELQDNTKVAHIITSGEILPDNGEGYTLERTSNGTEPKMNAFEKAFELSIAEPIELYVKGGVYTYQKGIELLTGKEKGSDATLEELKNNNYVKAFNNMKNSINNKMKAANNYLKDKFDNVAKTYMNAHIAELKALTETVTGNDYGSADNWNKAKAAAKKITE